MSTYLSPASISLSPPYLHTPSPPLSPSLISLMVSVDVKHHVYLLTYLLPPSLSPPTSIPPPPPSPSLISLMVSVDVKHHVYLLTYLLPPSLSPPHLHTTFPSFSPPLINLMVSVDVKHHIYLLTYCGAAGQASAGTG